MHLRELSHIVRTHGAFPILLTAGVLLGTCLVEGIGYLFFQAILAVLGIDAVVDQLLADVQKAGSDAEHFRH